MLNLRCSDAERQRAKSSVSAGVAVAADNSHSRLRKAQFGADHVHNPLVGRVHIEQQNAEFFAVLLQRCNLPCGDWIRNRRTSRLGGNVVIYRGHGSLWLAHSPARRSQPVKSLRRSNLMDKMQVDVEQRLLSGGSTH